MPCLFPSVSSVKANLRPIDYFELLVAIREPQFLVSAYDVAHATDEESERFQEAFKKAATSGSIVLLDSGNYESYWLRDGMWSPKQLTDVLERTPAQLSFCFDDQSPPANVADSVAMVDTALAWEQKFFAGTVLPIIHEDATTLPARTEALAERLQPSMLAVPERELGEGILQRLTTVRVLREKLDEVSPTSALHLLGTCNPLALLLYSFAGAESFDGLEWCQTCVEPATGWLHHFQHRDLVEVSAETREVIGSLPYTQGTLVHNLLFFRKWIRLIREAISSEGQAELLRRYLPSGRVEVVLSALSLAPR